MIMFCECVHVCAVCVHSRAVASCLIHTSCIIELGSGFWRQWASRISCYQEAVTWRWPAAMDGLPGSSRCSPVLSPNPPVLCLPCVGLVGFPCFADDSCGGARRKARVCRGTKAETWSLDQHIRDSDKTQISMEAIIHLSHWLKWLKELHTALHLLFYSCFWCIIYPLGVARRLLSHPYVLLYCFEMKKFTLSLCQDFTIYREVDVPISLVSLIKLRDASWKALCKVQESISAGTPSEGLEKLPDEKFHEWQPRIPFSLYHYFLLCLLWECSFIYCAIKTYAQHVATDIELNEGTPTSNWSSKLSFILQLTQMHVYMYASSVFIIAAPSLYRKLDWVLWC